MRFKNSAIVLGLSPAGLYLLRALSNAGITVYGVTNKTESGLFSKHILSKQHRWKGLNDLELLHRIRELATEDGVLPVLLPASDMYIEWISMHYSELKQIALFSGSYSPDRYIDFLDKDRFYSACQKVGVPYPGRIKLADFFSEGIAYKPGFPMLIKPGRLHEVSDVMGSRKVFICHDMEDLEKYMKLLPMNRGSWLVQEIVEGPDNDIYCLGGVHTGNGKILTPVSGRKLRQFPPGYGTAAAFSLESPPSELWTYTKKLLNILKLDGIFEIEFKQDEKDGLWKVFEINPRTALWFGAAQTAGIPLALSLYYIYVGSENLQLMEISESKVVWRTGTKNLIALFMQFIKRVPNREIYKKKGKTIASWAFWDFTDPMPAFIEMIMYVVKLTKKIIYKFIPKRGHIG